MSQSPLYSKEILYQWYITEKRSYRWIMNKLNFNSARKLKKMLSENSIPIRHGSEAIVTQWIGNVKRRKATSKRAKEVLISFWKEHDRSEIFTPEIRKKISQSKIGPKNAMYGKVGPLHHHFLGGKSTWEKGRKITVEKKRNLIQELGNQCSKCKSKKDLTLNHKIPWRIVRHHELWNLEVLCKKCHFSGPNKDR